MAANKPTPIIDATGADDMTATDRAYIAQLNREHLQRTEEIIRRLDAARDRLIVPEPENPLDAEGDDGIPITDPATGKMAIAPKGSPEYQAYLDEHAEAIEIYKAWEAAPINAEFVSIRHELAQAQEEYADTLFKYYQRIRNAPNIGTKPATEYVAPTDLVSYRVFSGDIGSVPENIRVSGTAAKKPVVTTVSIDFEAIEDDTAVSGRKRLDRYTQQVYQAIIALWNAGNPIMTIGMIYNTMTGSKDAKLNVKQADMITESIRNLMASVVTINASDEKNMRGYGALKASYYGNLLTAKAATVKIRGTRVDGAIQVFAVPILYEYARAKNQIATGNIELLNAPINKTPENIILIDYLRRRVDALPSPRTENKIRYASIYEALGISGNDDSAKKRKYRIRGYAAKILTYWKDQGHIQGFSEYAKEGRSYAEGIQITPTNDQRMIPQEEEA